MPQSKAKPKAARVTRASKPAQPKSVTKRGAKPKADAESNRAAGKAASRLIDQRIRELGDWRGKTLARMRALILEADPEIVEEWKWMGTPVWSRDGNLCTGETYKQVVKLTFARGASLDDPRKLFNSSLEGNTRRAIDLREGEALDAEAFRALIRAAIAENLRASAAKSKPAKKPAETKAAGKAKPGAKGAKSVKSESEKKIVLLSGGNPQIAKGEGDAPVQAYIAAMPGWKSDLGKQLDALIARVVPRVRKAVKWNSPFYGVEGQGWFLSFHVFTRYVKVTFFSGSLLNPIPPGGTPKSKDARWIDIHENEFNEAQMAEWVKQAAAIPGWIP